MCDRFPRSGTGFVTVRWRDRKMFVYLSHKSLQSHRHTGTAQKHRERHAMINVCRLTIKNNSRHCCLRAGRNANVQAALLCLVCCCEGGMGEGRVIKSCYAIRPTCRCGHISAIPLGCLRRPSRQGSCRHVRRTFLFKVYQRGNNTFIAVL